MQLVPVLAAVIDLDVTFFFQLVLFLVLVVVLDRLAFRPMLALFERRKEETEVREKQATQGSREAEELQDRVEREMALVAGEAMTARNALRDRALSREAERLGAVRVETSAWLDGELGLHRKEIEAVRAEAQPGIDALAADIVKVLTATGSTPGKNAQ